MAISFRNMHEVLGPYLSPVSPPTAVSVPSGTQIRLPVKPGGTIPGGGILPIPTTTQSNKKTNVQIPYLRRATETQDVGGVWYPSAGEGAIGLVEQQRLHRSVQQRMLNGLGPNAFVDVCSVEQINKAIAEPRVDLHTYDDFPYRVDGVVNNVDGADPQHEFKDYTLVNMAVQGHCRLDHREKYRADERVWRSGATIYVGLFATRKTVAGGGGGGFTQWVHKLERFSSSMITRSAIDLGDDNVAGGSLRVLLFAWAVGRIVDPAQSKDMLTIHVDVRPLRPIVQAEAQPYQPPNAAAGLLQPSHVLRWRLEEDAMRPGYYISVPDVFGDVVANRSVRAQLVESWVVV